MCAGLLSSRIGFLSKSTGVVRSVVVAAFDALSVAAELDSVLRFIVEVVGRNHRMLPRAKGREDGEVVESGA